MNLVTVENYINPSLSPTPRYSECLNYHSPLINKELLDPKYCRALISEEFGCQDTRTFIQLYEINPPNESRKYVAVAQYLGSCEGCFTDYYRDIKDLDGTISLMDLVKEILRPMILRDTYDEAKADAKRLTTEIWAELIGDWVFFNKQRKKLEKLGLLSPSKSNKFRLCQ